MKMGRRESGAKPPRSLVKQAKEYVGENGIPGDSWGSFSALNIRIDMPDVWGTIQPVQTYQDYVSGHVSINFPKSPEIAGIIITRSNKELVAKYNSIVQKINGVVGEGVTTQAQADQIRGFLNEADDLIYQRSKQK